MKLVFATNNLNKLSEVKSLVRTNASVLSLDEIGCSDEIPETFPTIEENALQKAEYIYNKFGYNCFSDDSALEIDFLNGEPEFIQQDMQELILMQIKILIKF